jgi:hypothetical protein
LELVLEVGPDPTSKGIDIVSVRRGKEYRRGKREIGKRGEGRGKREEGGNKECDKCDM